MKGKVLDHIRSMKIRNKIVVFYLSLVLVSVFLSVFLYYRLSGSYLDASIHDLSINEVQNHDRSLELLLEDISSYSKEIISSPSIQTTLDPNQQQIYALKKVDQELAASMMFDNKISSVYVFDFEGKKYYRDKEVYKNLQMEDIMAKDWYQDLEALRGGYLFNFNGDGLIQDQGHDYLSFFRIINSTVDHQPVGLLMVNVVDTTIQDFFNMDESTYRQVVIEEQVYHTAMILENQRASDLIQAASRDDDAALIVESVHNEFDVIHETILNQDLFFEEISIGNQDYNFTGISNETYGWIIEEVRAGQDRTSMIAIFNMAIIIIILVNSVVIIYGSYVFSGYITTPITKLTQSMRAVEQGTFLPVEVTTNEDEIGRLKEGYNYMIVQIQQLIEAVIKEQQVIKDAELRLIMEQMKPHFLYNTLDAISSLLMLERYQDAEKALTALAKFYRNSLSDGRSVISLETEIAIIKNYLLIQSIRYKDLFEVVYDIDEEVLDMKVPKLMLQPLVENSLYHGIRPMGMDGIIEVRARKSSGQVVIEVKDNGIGMTDSVIEGVFSDARDKGGQISSVGLPATIKRVAHMYDNRAQVTINSQGEGTLVRILIRDLERGDRQ